MTDRSSSEIRGAEDVRGEPLERGAPLDRGISSSSGENLMRRKFLARSTCCDDSEPLIDDIEEEDYYMPNIIALAGKELGSPIVVFPDTIAGGSYIPGTLVRIVDNWLIQISVGTVCIQDGPWKPVSPFVAGDQAFVPIRSIDAFV